MTEGSSRERKWENVVRRMLGKARALSDERGVGLVESLIAVAIVGIALVVFLAALSTGSMAVGTSKRNVTAENLARSQMEDVKGQTYAASYSTMTEPEGYDITITVSDVNGRDQNEIQKITVEVSYEGDAVTVEDYKVDR